MELVGPGDFEGVVLVLQGDRLANGQDRATDYCNSNRAASAVVSVSDARQEVSDSSDSMFEGDNL